MLTWLENLKSSLDDRESPGTNTSICKLFVALGTFSMYTTYYYVLNFLAKSFPSPSHSMTQWDAGILVLIDAGAELV